MQTNKNKQFKEILLVSNPRSPYSILTALVFLLLIGGSLMLFLKYQDRIGIALALCIIPLVIALFMLKLLLWNVGGKEIIQISTDQTEVQMQYPLLFSPMVHQENSRMKSILFNSNTQADLVRPQEIVDLRLSNSLYKLKLEFANGETYISSISFDLHEAQRIVNLIRS